MYQLVLNFPGGVPQVVKRLADNVFIPFDPANTDYQQFFRWCEEGNQPLPADDNGQAAE